jgi:hypothetical protein
MRYAIRLLALLFSALIAPVAAQDSRQFETVLLAPQPVVAGQPMFATMVWTECFDSLSLVGGTVSVAAPNVIRVRAEFEGFGGLVCFVPLGRAASLPFHAPTAGTWTIDFAGTVRYRTSGGALGPPTPISLRTPPTAVVVNEPAPIPATSRGGLAALAMLLVLVAVVSMRQLGGRVVRS